MNQGMWNTILDEFTRSYPGIASKMVDSYPSGYLEITVRTADGNKLRYDYADKTFRFLENVDISEMTEDEWLGRFSENLHRKLHDKGMTQKDLAEVTGTSVASIGKYVNGKTAPSSYVLSKIANALECSVSSLTYFN